MSVHRDVDAELRFHFEARIDELMRQGLSREKAHARALDEFGDVDAVRVDLQAIDTRVARRRNRVEWIEGVRQDVVYAARSLRRAPAVSLTIILTLALGLGANAAMFSLLDVIFLRPPAGVVQPGAVRRVWVRERFTSGVMYWPGFDYSTYTAIAQAMDGRALTTTYRRPSALSLGRGENAPTAAVAGAASSYFDFLGVKPQLGRFYSADEDRVNTPTPVAVVSDAFWRRALDGDRDAVGREITIANAKYTVIGVAPPSFSGTELDATDVWLPLATAVGGRRSGVLPWWQNSNVNGFQVLVRLPHEAPEGELTARLTSALRAPGLGHEHDTLTVASFGSILAANGPGDVKAEYQVATRLAGVAVIVLLIACANVINLLLARAVTRRREIAVRIALGVSRARLVRLLVTESAILAVVAGAGALLAASWGGTALRRLLVPEVHFANSPVSVRVLGFAFVLALVAGAVAGVFPALQSIAPDVASALKAGAREGGARGSALRDVLVAAQAALSVLLLVGAVLFVRSLDNVRARDIGYSVDRLVFASVSYDSRDTARDNQLPGRLRSLATRIASIAGVERLAFASTRPKYSISFTAYTPDFDPAGRRIPTGIFTAVSPEYFAAVGMKLLRGRTLSADRGSNAPFELVVNHAMADSLWPNQDPLIHCVHFEKRDAPCAAVVGVVETAREAGVGEKPSPQFYVSVDHAPVATWGGTDIIARVDPSQTIAVQHALHDLLRDQFAGSIPKLTTMEQVMEPVYRPWKLGATIFTLFGLLALVVAAIGIYSSVSYAVSQRTHEFGVRLALGAQLGDVLRQVLGKGLRVVAAGVVIGILMALAAGRLVASLLYGIAPNDPFAMATVAAMLLSLATIAAFAPAWRAAKADPVTALRAE